MTFYGGGEIGVPEYEGGTLLLMPTLHYDDWQLLDQETIKTLIAALRIAGSIKADRRVPYLSQASAAVLKHIQKLQIAAAESAVPERLQLRGGGSPMSEGHARELRAFPGRLRGQAQLVPLAGQESIWELYGYGEAIFEEMVDSGRDVVVGSFEHLPDLVFNAYLAQKLFQEFERLGFPDRSDSPTPDLKQARIVDFGCDLKLLLTWLSFVGPVRCEIKVDDRFSGLKSTGAAAPPAERVHAVVPTPAGELVAEEYVVVVACRPRGELEQQMKREPLNQIIPRLERDHLPFDAQYLLRRVTDAGQVIQDWGDGGYAWMAHADFRRCFRHGQGNVPANIVEMKTPR